MSNTDLPQVTIYTDGACKPNPGHGGWAAVLLLPGQKPQELFGNQPNTTNNQMELQAALEALSSLPESYQIDMYTDSQYLKRGINEWLSGWEKRGWDNIKNQALWRKLSVQVKRHKIKWHWVKGHRGNKWNERADYLARSGIPKTALHLDDEQAIHIFTAAAYSGKSKKGGWAALLRYRDNQKPLSGTENSTSGNRMHIQAAIEGLQAVKKPLPIHIYTVSDYLKNGATSWVNKWSANNWRTTDGKSVSHRDLWETLHGLSATYQIRWHIVLKSDMPSEMTQAKKLAAEAGRGKF